MSLLSGTLGFTRFKPEDNPLARNNLLTALQDNRFRPFQDGSDRERVGWASWRNPLITDIKEEDTFFDGYAVFSLRVDTRKIPPTLLNTHLELKIARLMETKDLKFVGKEARTALKEEVIDELLPKMVPTTKTIDLAWNLKENVLCTTATSKSDISRMRTHFLSTFNSVPHIITPTSVVEGHPNYDDSLETEDIPSNYLIWLWKESQINSGVMKLENTVSSMSVEHPIVLTIDRGYVQKITLDKGNPTESFEGFNCLSKEMLPQKLKIRLIIDDEQWTCTLSASNLAITGLSLPKPQKTKERLDKLLIISQRLAYLKECITHLDARFNAYLDQKLTDQDKLNTDIQKWIAEGLETTRENN